MEETKKGSAKSSTSFDGEQFATLILLFILIFLGIFGTTDIETPEFPIS